MRLVHPLFLEAVMVPSSPTWCVLLLTLLLGLLPASTSLALNIQLEGPNRGPVIDLSGVEFASMGDLITFEVSIEGGPTAISAYDLSIGWDQFEVDLVSAVQLAPDTGVPVAFSPSPVDGVPNGSAGSRAAAILTLPGTVLTTLLFSVTFDVLVAPITDGQPDVFVFVDNLVNGASGIIPASMAVENQSGAGFDIRLPEPASAVLLVAGLLLLASRRRRQWRRSTARSVATSTGW